VGYVVGEEGGAGPDLVEARDAEVAMVARLEVVVAVVGQQLCARGDEVDGHKENVREPPVRDALPETQTSGWSDLRLRAPAPRRMLASSR
jgi:hypothetical protein